MPEKALNYIGGKWTWPSGARVLTSLNPANHKDVVCIFPDSPASEVNRAVISARNAFPAWKLLPAPQRAKIIRRAGEIMASQKSSLGGLVTRECGKPLVEGLGDVQEAIDMAEMAAGEGRRLYGETTPSELPNKMCFTIREPVGVCGLITPWNFPVAIPAWKALHALICGNTVILKPAEDTPLCAVAFVKALEKAGIPPGVVNLVLGTGETTGGALVNHRGIDLISFTGSTETGRKVAQICAKTNKRVSLECGGKNAQIILADARLDLAIEGALWGAFGTAGQRCTATSRLIIEMPVYKEVLDRLVRQASRLALGPGLKKGTQVGPLINERQFKRVMDYIRTGKKEGAKLLCGGVPSKKPGLSNGWFVEPTIFAGVSREMRIYREEIFGPVLSVIQVADRAEAIEFLNDCSYGLSSSIYTQDINGALASVRDIDAGIVYVNGPTIGAEVHLPFGGVKQSGNGHREAGRTGLDIFTEWKTVYVDYSGKLQRAQIDNS
jgi:acyl-CoA reductase-like NAD-dependent aldehyde dehydrogenase